MLGGVRLVDRARRTIDESEKLVEQRQMLAETLNRFLEKRAEVLEEMCGNDQLAPRAESERLPYPSF
jgi:hypothetical protein